MALALFTIQTKDYMGHLLTRNNMIINYKTNNYVYQVVYNI